MPGMELSLPRRRAQFETAAAAEECDSPVATGVNPTGVWQ